jgi:arginase
VVTLRVPYHLDEYLPDLDFPLGKATVITADLPPGDTWARLAALYRQLAGAVSDAVRHGHRPVVVSGDCTTALGTVAEHRVVLAGARDLDPPEIAYLQSALIRRAQIPELDAAMPAGPLYVHLDVDVIDPAAVPGLRYPAPGGPDRAQVAAALGMLLATGRVAAVGIACTWHPGHGAAAAIDPQLKAALAAD